MLSRATVQDCYVGTLTAISSPRQEDNLIGSDKICVHFIVRTLLVLRTEGRVVLVPLPVECLVS